VHVVEVQLMWKEWCGFQQSIELALYHLIFFFGNLDWDKMTDFQNIKLFTPLLTRDT